MSFYVWHKNTYFIPNVNYFTCLSECVAKGEFC